jgi:hypothetical protein
MILRKELKNERKRKKKENTKEKKNREREATSFIFHYPQLF